MSEYDALIEERDEALHQNEELKIEVDNLRAKLEVLTGGAGLNIVSAIMSEHLNKKEHYVEWTTKTMDGREFMISAQWLTGKSPATFHTEIKTAFEEIVRKVERAYAALETLNLWAFNTLDDCDYMMKKIKEIQVMLTLGSTENEKQEALPLGEAKVERKKDRFAPLVRQEPEKP